jgi:3-oxoacyl-[acyl-carrier protein] reductase
MGNVMNFLIDLSSLQQVQEAAERLSQCVGSKTMISLVHNAGFYKRDSIDSVSLEDLQATFAVNVISPILLNKIFLPFMLPGSSIIYIGSTLAEKAVPNSVSYTVSKHALKGLMKTTCQDLAGREIQTCCINPGLVDTALLRDTMETKALDNLLNTKIIGKRLIKPEEIAKIIHFCATATALNGATIDANLGERDL